MAKTLVNIISEQTVPNYLFIREVFEIGDGLLFISSKKMKDRIDWLVDTLGWANCQIDTIIFNHDGDEEKWDLMHESVSKHLSSDKVYFVNLTGGTKYMALATQSIFGKFNAKFFYIPYPKNQILDITNSQTIDIQYRVGVNEYFRLCGQNVRCSGEIVGTPEYTASFLGRFLGDFKGQQFQVIDKLRAYREAKKGIDVALVEQKEDEPKKPQIVDLSTFLSSISFQSTEQLNKSEIQYLTGGWFEEYVYNYINDYIHPNDILIGVKVESTNNDLDVVFTLGNKLYVIECKTGVERKGMLNEIVYKASALKSSLFALSARSYIFALSEDNQDWALAAQNMNITYCGRTHFTDTGKLNVLLDYIQNLSNN